MLNPWLGVIAAGMTTAAIWYLIDTLRTFPLRSNDNGKRNHKGG